MTHHNESSDERGELATPREILHPAEAGFRMTSMYCGGIRLHGWDLLLPRGELGNPQVRRQRPRTGVSALLGLWSFGLQEFADYLFYVAVLAVDGVV
jgi:hypothetical protein